MKKVVIVDDEEAGRKLIREYLEHHGDMVLLGQANNGVDAIKIINEFQPDLVFLDIQMPGLNGFEVLTHLDEIPDVIFSTAYDQYALKAFEVHAVDYLLKPFTRERFDTALSRAISKSSSDRVAPLADQHLMQQKDYPQRMIVEKGQKYVTLATDSIEFVEAFGDYTKLHSPDGIYLSNHGIGALEQKLNPQIFMRVHRSYIVHLDKVHELEKYGKSFLLRMKGGEKIKVSRSHADKIKELMM